FARRQRGGNGIAFCMECLQCGEVDLRELFQKVVLLGCCELFPAECQVFLPVLRELLDEFAGQSRHHGSELEVRRFLFRGEGKNSTPEAALRPELLLAVWVPLAARGVPAGRNRRIARSASRNRCQLCRETAIGSKTAGKPDQSAFDKADLVGYKK